MTLLRELSMPRIGLLFIICFICISPVQASNIEIVDQLKNCARMEQDTDRMACYESLGKSVLGDENQGTDVQSAAETTSTPSQSDDGAEQAQASEALPEGLGGGVFADRAGRKVETNRGRVTSCKKASDRKWFYIFENGQVWKQVDSRKRRHRNCDFMVTVTKDSFGYKMVIDGQDSKIRIDRRR